MRRHGVGTFVAKDKIHRPANHLFGLHDGDLARGLLWTSALEPSTRKGQGARITRHVRFTVIIVVARFAAPLANLDATGSVRDGVRERLGCEFGEAA